MGGPGGPGNPLAFGKSKAKFQMEPNTGVTFGDVAGVDEAKQDFMEVCICKEHELHARHPEVVTCDLGFPNFAAHMSHLTLLPLPFRPADC